MVRPANTNAAAKFEALMKYLDRSAADLARATGLGESFFSKVRSGTRGIGADAAQTIERSLQIDRRYWDDESPADPARFHMSLGPRPVPALAPPTVAAPPSSNDDLAAALQRARALDLARRHGAPEHVLLALLRATPPAGADAWWWFEAYLDLVRVTP